MLFIGETIFVISMAQHFEFQLLLTPCCFVNEFSPEPHILLFRRPLGTDPQSGRVDPELERQARDEYKNQFGLMRK